MELLSGLKLVAGRMSQMAALAVLSIGILVLIGWQFDIQLLKAGMLGSTATMKANSALCFVLLGAALLWAGSRPQRLWFTVGLAIPGWIGLLSLSQYLFGWNLGIDQLLFADQVGQATSHPGRMGFNTAICFVLASLSLGLIHWRRIRLGQFLALLTLLISLQSLVGYAFGVQVFYRMSIYTTSMALHTALTLTGLAAGILALQPQQGWMRLLTSELDGSRLARQLLPAAILFPVGLGWLLLQGYRLDYYDASFALSLQVVLSIVVQTGLIGQSVSRLNRNNLKRQQAEAQLRDSEGRFRQIAQSINDVFWMTDPQRHRLVYISPRYAEVWGRPSQELEQNWLSWLDGIHPEDRPRVEQAFLQISPTQKYSEEFRIVRPDGSIRWVRDRGYPVLNALGQMQYISGIAEDITERKQLEAEYNGFFTLSLDMLAVAGMDGYFKQINPAFEQTLGYSEAELMACPFVELVHPDDRAATLAESSKLQNGQPTLHFENRYRCKDGSYRWLDWVVAPVVEQDLLYAVAHDVTQRKQLEQELRDSEARFRRLFDSNIIGAMFVGLQGEITEANDALLYMLGYSREDLQAGKLHWRQMTPPEYFTQDEQILAELRQQGVSPPFEKEYYRQDGSRVSVLLGAALLPDANSAICYVLDLSERKQAEYLLRRSEERYRSLIEATTSLVWSTDAAGKFVAAQPLWEAYTGQSFEEYQGWGWSAALHPGDRARVEQAWQQALISRQIHQMEGRLWHQPTGEYRYFEARGVPILEPDGTIREWVGTVNDLHDRKQAEATLRKNEARLNSFVEADLIGILFGDIYGNISYANNELLNMIGYSRDDLETGRLSWLEITPPEYLPLDELGIAEARSRGACTPYEKEYIRKDGSRVPVLVGYRLLEPTREQSVAFILDLSEQKQAEAALRESEARFRYMADHAPMLVWMSDASGHTYFNRAWLAFTGEPAQLGQGWTAQIYPDDAQRYAQTYAAAFEARQPYELEYRLRRADGDYRWLLDIGRPRLTPEGEFLGYIGSSVDIHDRKQAEAETQQLNELLERRVKERTAQLESANKELESFSYSVSHDLRAPLRHIAGFVDLLQKRLDPTSLDDTSQRYLTIITETTRQAGTLIDDLLAFSRMGRTEMRSMTVNMTLLVQEIRQELEPDLLDRTVDWQIASLPSIQGDPSMLRLVLRNLLENAVKYTRLRPLAEIAIGSFSQEQEVVFWVRDNGIGFNMQYAHKLFGIFQRLHSDPNYEGTGIGLANVRRIVHRHGGRAWAEGKLNEGSTFFFSLPRSIASASRTDSVN